jgi:DNA-binding response OmpR family regulator
MKRKIRRLSIGGLRREFALIDGYCALHGHVTWFEASTRQHGNDQMHEENSAEGRIALPGALVHLGNGKIEFKDGTQGLLRGRELQLFEFLVQNRDRVISRAEILAKVWGLEGRVLTRTVDMHVSFLRKKLQLGGALRAVRAVGYILELG